MIDSRLWRAGEYTDDTQMALLIAESLLERNGFQISDLSQRFQVWATNAKDVGSQTRAVVNMAGYSVIQGAVRRNTTPLIPTPAPAMVP
jgi:ADP-ribosylglycohydrolase